MTEQEAEIKRVISYIRSCREAGIDTTITLDKDKSHFILNALEEVRQYRALGTVEECREAVEQLKAAKEDIRKLLCSEYGSSCQFCIQDGNEDAMCCNVGGSGSWCCENAAWNSHR